MQRQTQVQKMADKAINSKLNVIIKRLDTLMSMVEDEIYPDESRMKKSYLKKEAALDKALMSGKIKLHRYRKLRRDGQIDKLDGALHGVWRIATPEFEETLAKLKRRDRALYDRLGKKIDELVHRTTFQETSGKRA